MGPVGRHLWQRCIRMLFHSTFASPRFWKTPELFTQQSSKKLEMFCHMIEQWCGWVQSLPPSSMLLSYEFSSTLLETPLPVDSQNSVIIIQGKYNWPIILRDKLEVVFSLGWCLWSSSSRTTPSSVEVKYAHLWDGWNIAQTQSVQNELTFPSNLLIPNFPSPWWITSLSLQPAA